MSDTKPFIVTKRWSHIQEQVWTENIKITGEAVCAEEEAAAMLPIELKLIKEKGLHVQEKGMYMWQEKSIRKAW